MELLTTQAVIKREKSEKTQKEYIMVTLELPNGKMNLFLNYKDWFEFYYKAGIKGGNENA